MTAENDRGDRFGACHVVIRGDQIDVVNVLLFQIADQGGEVGHSIQSAVVEVDAIVGNVLLAKEGVCIVGSSAQRTPRFSIRDGGEQSQR